MINIIKNSLDIKKLKEEVHFYSIVKGTDPKYIVMNTKTAQDLFNDMTTEDFVVKKYNGEYCMSFCEIDIVYSPKLEYGEVDFVE